MTFSALQKLRASELNDMLDRLDVLEANRVGTTIRTSTPSTFTAETVLDSLTVNLVSGVTYKVLYAFQVSSSVADGYVRARIRETNVSGTIMQVTNTPTTITANQSITIRIEAEYTAASTGSKTFVGTAVRQAGTGNISAFADATAPAYLYVDRIRD